MCLRENYTTLLRGSDVYSVFPGHWLQTMRLSLVRWAGAGQGQGVTSVNYDTVCHHKILI